MGLATCDTNLPLREWDKLLPKGEITLTLLDNSHINPKLSSWAFLVGNHHFSRTPLLPSTKVGLYAKPGKRASWSFHRERGWYIGPATN